MPLSGGVSGPLAFALVTHWLGAALEFLWHSVVGGAALQYLQDISKLAGNIADVDNPGTSARIFQLRDQVLHWFWGTGSVIVDPFLTLGSILFTTLFVYVGARILVSPDRAGAPREITYESALRIICFGLSPSILAGIPLVGGLISSLAVGLVTIVVAREAYRISTGRAVLVALFPKLLLLATFAGGLFFFFLVILKLFATAF